MLNKADVAAWRSDGSIVNFLVPVKFVDGFRSGCLDNRRTKYGVEGLQRGECVGID